ncbi:unnamed protein product [Dovyalis caffra]|uniref:Uncharacterized protein n=1 Tax=Dovyalis caffra TaxID=77055 RepID=A0AAV1RN51_9ROSI|nr:unnamed protein product [Dovyalis caffra]
MIATFVVSTWEKLDWLLKEQIHAFLHGHIKDGFGSHQVNDGGVFSTAMTAAITDDIYD